MVEAVLVVGKVDLRQCLLQRQECVCLQIVLGEDFVEQVNILVERPAHDFSHLPLQQTFGQAVNGQ